MISVIVPVYNVELYLHECIQSIVTQTFRDIEIILIDDGSTDSSGMLCDKWAEKDKRIKVIHKPNGGLSSARNAGIDIAVGKYMIFVDSDDYWLGTDSLAHLYDTAEKFGADVVRGEYIAVNNKGERIKTINKNKSEYSNKPLDSTTFYTKAIAGENFSVLFFFKKDTISTLRFDEERKFQEDIDFNIKYFSTPRKCVYVDNRFYAYRKREASIITTPRISNLEGSFSLCEVFQKYSKFTADAKLKETYQYNSVMMYYWTLETLASAPYYAKHLEIIKDLSLCKRQKRVSEWARKNRRHYPFYIYINPHIGTKILRIELLIKGTILKYGSKCKRTIYKWIKK
jgi:glycosyltransferase involved in cell wall biosynthesis